MIKKIIKFLRIILASLLILTGIVGLVLPIFPTVPFLAAAAIVMGKKPSEVMDFFRWLSKAVKIKIFEFIQKLNGKNIKHM